METTRTATETTIHTAEGIEVTYDPQADPEDTYQYSVYDLDGECLDGFNDRDEALAYAEELAAEIEADRINDLQHEIEARVAECEDLGKLEKILALLK